MTPVDIALATVAVLSSAGMALTTWHARQERRHMRLLARISR